MAAGARLCGYPLNVAAAPPLGKTWGVSRTEVFAAIVGLFVLEIYHLKWLWWEHWKCRTCRTEIKNCSCGPPPRWFTYL